MASKVKRHSPQFSTTQEHVFAWIYSRPLLKNNAMDAKLWAFIAVMGAFCAIPISAHDVIWPGNPTGFTPREPLRIQFGAEAVVEVKPVTGESCIVAVNLDPVASTLVKAEIITGNPALQVNIRITVLRAATNASEMAVISGEWHATGSPEPQECTAVDPNRFAVSVQVLGGPPPATLSEITPQAAPPGSAVVITGTGFTGITEVAFGGIPAEFLVVDAQTIRAVAPPNAPVGRVAVSSAAGKIESAAVFVVQPEIKIMSGMNGAQLVWDNRNYPFTLQRSRSLGEPLWMDLITTLENSVNLPVENGPAFYRLSWMEIPLDHTDYNRDRWAVAQYYHRDPLSYWATFGIPALARLAVMRENVGADPSTPFQGFLQGFDSGRLLTALERGDLPSLVSEGVSNQLSAGMSVTNAFVKTLISLVKTNDATNCAAIIRTNCIATNSLAPVFTKVMTNWASSNTWSGWAPQTNKTLFSTNQITNNRGINWIDGHGSHSFTQVPRPTPAPNSDSNTATRVKWENITSSFTDTTYNGACASLTVGASLAKLGLIAGDTTPQFWNDLSRLLGSQPGTLGAYTTDIAAFYETLGYGAAEAYDGPAESAVEEAKKALERGCDVAILYQNTDATRAHIEFVTDIQIDSADSAKATVSTLSWGHNATVSYNGSITGGTYSGKSDGQSYRKSSETVSYLEQTGSSRLLYYCKKE